MTPRTQLKSSLNWRLGEQLLHFRTAVLLLVLGATWALSVFIYAFDRSLWREWQGGLLILSLVLIIVIGRFLWLDYVKPSRNLRNWLLNVHAGDLSARVPEVEGSSFNALCNDFNSMAHMLESQARRGITQLQHHTEHLTDKTRMQEREWIARADNRRLALSGARPRPESQRRRSGGGAPAIREA